MNSMIHLAARQDWTQDYVRVCVDSLCSVHVRHQTNSCIPSHTHTRPLRFLRTLAKPLSATTDIAFDEPPNM